MAVGWLGFAVLPWYGLDSNFFTLSWLFDGYPLDSDVAPALFLVAQGQKLWLAPLGHPARAAAASVEPAKDPIRCSAGC